MRLRFFPPSRKACSRPYASSQKVFWLALRFVYPRPRYQSLTALRRAFQRSHSAPESSGPEVVPVIESTTKPGGVVGGDGDHVPHGPDELRRVVQLAGLFPRLVVGEKAQLHDGAGVVRHVAAIRPGRERAAGHLPAHVDHRDREALRGQALFRELRHQLLRDLREGRVEGRRGIQRHDRGSLLGRRERGREARREEEDQKRRETLQGRAPGAPRAVWRRRARTTRIAIVPATAKGIDTMRRIDQNMPRHIEGPLSATSSLQSGQAESTSRQERREQQGANEDPAEGCRTRHRPHLTRIGPEG